MKRAKLIAGLLSCMMCLAMLTIGVWAVASVATLDINGNLKFYPEGLFVQLSGEVYRGNSSTESEMTKLSDPRFNYGPVANFDNTQDELSGNFPLEAWEIGNVAFIPNQRFIKIKVYTTNYSDFAITGTPTVTIGGQDISETITGLTVTSNTSELESITSNTTATYELILEATGSTEFSKSLNVSFEFEEYEEIVLNYDYFTINSDYLESGGYGLITGLTDQYTQNSPRTLIIPGYTQDNQNPLTISNSALNDLSDSTTRIIIQDGLLMIGREAFYGKSNITSISIPDSVESIGVDAFYGCSNLLYEEDGITYMKNTEEDGSVNNYFAIYDLALPDITNLTINSNCKFIFNNAFEGISATNLVIPEGVVGIGGSAFTGSKLQSVTLPSTLKSWDADHDIFQEFPRPGDQGVFEDCTSLTSVTFSEDINNIGSRAFNGCTALESIVFPCYLSVIKEYAFAGCTSLNFVSFDDVAKLDIESFAFYNCTSLSSLEITHYIDEDGNFVCTLMDIASDAFIGCTNLITEDSNGLQYIRSSFESDYNDYFALVSVPDDYYCHPDDPTTHINENCKIIAGFDYYAYSMFRSASIENLVLPSGLIVISKGAFYYAESLYMINIPDSVSYIGQYAFSECYYLAEVYFEGQSDWNIGIFEDGFFHEEFYLEYSEFEEDPSLAAYFLIEEYYINCWIVWDRYVENGLVVVPV